MTEDRRRWDIDERGVGVADASALAPPIDELAALARQAGWVAEDPEAHLLPHLRAAIEADGSPWRLIGYATHGHTIRLRVAGRPAGDAR